MSRAPGLPPAVPSPAPAAACEFDSRFGRWRGPRRRRRARRAGCTDGDRFQARAACRPRPGVRRNAGTFPTDGRGGFQGVAPRLAAPGAAREPVGPRDGGAPWKPDREMRFGRVGEVPHDH